MILTDSVWMLEMIIKPGGRETELNDESTLTLSAINVPVCPGDTYNIGLYLIIHQSRICIVEEDMMKTIPCEKWFSMMLKNWNVVSRFKFVPIAENPEQL